MIRTPPDLHVAIGWLPSAVCHRLTPPDSTTNSHGWPLGSGRISVADQQRAGRPGNLGGW